MANKVRQTIEENPVYYNDQKIDLTVSGGIAQFGRDGADLQGLISRADECLYKAKDDGRNRILVYVPAATG